MADEPTGGPDVSKGQPVEQRSVVPPELQPPLAVPPKDASPK